MTIRITMLGVRDQKTLNTLSKLGFDVPAAAKLTVDESAASELEPMVMQLQELVSALARKLKTMGEEKESMSEDMQGMAAKLEDMPTVEEAQAKLEAAQKELEDAKKAASEMKKTSDAHAAKIAEQTTQIETLTATVSDLQTELAPVRTEQLNKFRRELVDAGLDETKAKACKDSAELRRAFVVSRVSDEYAKTDDAKEFVHSDDDIKHTFNGVWAGLQTRVAKSRDEHKPGYTPGVGLQSIPTPTPVSDAKDKPATPITEPKLDDGAQYAAVL